MRLILLFVLLSFSCKAQSLYEPRRNTKVSYIDQEDFTITFEKSLYGLIFRQNDRKLTNDLQNKIAIFMKNTNRPQYKKPGTYTLNIILRGNKYFVVESRKPEKLLPL